MRRFKDALVPAVRHSKHGLAQPIIRAAERSDIAPSRRQPSAICGSFVTWCRLSSALSR